MENKMQTQRIRVNIHLRVNESYCSGLQGIEKHSLHTPLSASGLWFKIYPVHIAVSTWNLFHCLPTSTRVHADVFADIHSNRFTSIWHINSQLWWLLFVPFTSISHSHPSNWRHCIFLFIFFKMHLGVSLIKWQHVASVHVVGLLSIYRLMEQYWWYRFL